MAKKDERNIEMGKFLRKKREGLTGETYGIQSYSKRRTLGMRREEVAVLAGVSVTWYTWLEQGRDINVSVEILERIATVLKLTEDEKEYLFALAQQYKVLNREDDLNEIMKRMTRLLEQLKECPSYIIDRQWNVLCWNEACTQLFGDFSQVEYKNILWMMFFNERYKKIFIDWQQAAKGMLARYKKVTANLVNDLEWRKMIETIGSDSKLFHEWWSEECVNIPRVIYKQCIHPLKGVVNYELSCLQVQENSNYTLIIHVPCSE